MKRFVPAEFLGMLGKSSVEQVGLGDNARQDMTVMFADIRSFSTMSEKLSPEETFRFIDDVFAELCPIFPGAYFHVGGDEAMRLQEAARVVVRVGED